jgi:hypothetical protein
MKILKILRNALLAAIIPTFFATTAFASTTHTGNVYLIGPGGANGIVVSIFLNTPAPAGECAAGGGRWTIQTDDPLYKTKMATLLTAASTGKSVTLVSTGTCGAWGSYIIDSIFAYF